jgi:hypothetical protein
MHPEVMATVACATCRKPCCATCDFAFPGGVHLCPECAVTTPTGLSAKRARMRTWSFACATLATISVGAMMGGAVEGMPDEAAGTLFSMLVLMPAIVGTGLGMGSYDRRLANPPSVWVAAGWNLGLLGLTLILVIVGMVTG